MMPKMIKECLIKALLLSLIWEACLFIGPRAISAEKGTNVSEKSSIVVIQRKDKYAIMTSEQRFFITERTKIFDLGGKEITIRDLPVPCKAQIQDQPLSNNYQEALKITIREVSLGASTDLSTPVPE